MIVGHSDDYACDNECEPYVTVQKHRPVDEGFNDLPREKGFSGLEKQSLAADIQALADNDSIQKRFTFDPSALQCQTQ